MERIKYKVSILLTFCLIVTGMVLAMPKVSAATGPPPADWAFEESSRPLNDAIVEAYPTLGDANGYVTIPAANARTGNIVLTDKGITGTINGIENFVNLSKLHLSRNSLSGEIPSAIGNMTVLYDLYLNGNNLTGTIPTSITTLTGLSQLQLQDNNLTGSLPSAIGDMTNIVNINLINNQLTGEIPTSIGSLSNLTHLQLTDNQLSGNIPDSLGSISSLQGFYIENNNINGSIPTTIGSLNSLLVFNVGGNNISGEIPDELFNLPALRRVTLYDNNVTGNPALGFASSTSLNYLDIRGTSLIQACPDITTLSYTVGTFLYDDLAADLLAGNKTTLADGVTQDTIDKAQESTDFITDPTEKQQWQDDINLAQQMLDAKTTVDGLLNGAGDNLAPGITESDIDNAQDLVTALPDGSLKDELQAKIDTARYMLDAKAKTDGLLTTDGANLKPGVDKGKIDDAQKAVNKLPNGELKDELQSKIDAAKNLLDAEKKVGGLIGPDGKLKPGVDKGKVDQAQAAVNKLPNGDTKDRLQSVIDEAYKLLNAKVTGSTGDKDSDGVSVSKTTAVGGTKTIVKSVATGDSTNYMLYLILLVASLSVMTLVIARRKNNAK